MQARSTMIKEPRQQPNVDKAEKIRHYATAKRATAGTITQIVNGDFVTSWVGKLRGMIVSAPDGTYKHATKAAALACAVDVRDRCRVDLATQQETSSHG